MEGRPGIVYKIPENLIQESNSIKYLQQNGVYFLIYQDDDESKPAIYIGQAGVRKDGKGVLGRAIVPHPSMLEWTEVILVTTTDDSLGPTEISFLENKFYNLAKKCNRYKLTNQVEPTKGNLSEEKECVLDELADYIQMIVGTMGYRMFESNVKSSAKKSERFYTKLKGCTAYGKQTNEGFVVLKGSELVMEKTKSCPDFVIKNREKYADKIKDGKLLEDISFFTPSGAATFVHYSSANGRLVWKREKDNKSLNDIAAEISDKFESQ